jgi:hypothetical protein
MGMPDPKKQVVGTWKVDIENTTVPISSDKEKADEASLRLTVKAGGTFATTGGTKPTTGTWKIVDGKLSLKSVSDKDTVPPLSILPDGSSLSAELKQGDKSFAIRFVKA